MEVITELAKKQLALEEQIIKAEEDLKKLKGSYDQVRCVDLPEKMQELELTSFTLENGTTITIKHDLRAYIRVEDKFTVHAWLKEHNLGSIIKTSVIASFESGESEKAEKLQKQLLKSGVRADKKEDIHWQTFTKCIKELLAEGQQLHDKIQIQSINEARVK
jgi:hypothetical protein